MPYITNEKRRKLDTSVPDSPGELNYVFTRMIQQYIYACGLNYTTINDIVGALECAKQEFYRRIVVPYEEKKIKENGDVYNG